MLCVSPFLLLIRFRLVYFILRIANKTLEKGLICRLLGAAIVLGPPFIITEAEIDEVFDILEEAMQNVFSDVGLN